MTKFRAFSIACVTGAVLAAGLFSGGVDPASARERNRGGSNVEVRDHRTQPVVRDHRTQPTVRDHRKTDKPARSDVSNSPGGVKVTNTPGGSRCRAQVCATGNERPGRGRWKPL